MDTSFTHCWGINFSENGGCKVTDYRRESKFLYLLDYTLLLLVMMGFIQIHHLHSLRRLPSDSTSRWTPLPLAVTFPLSGRFGDLRPLEYVRAGRTTENARRKNYLLLAF